MGSTKRDVALAFIQSFENLDGEANLALRAPNCLHTIAPMSLGYPPNMTNDDFAAHLAPMKEIVATFPVTAKEVFVDEASNQVTIWAKSIATFKEELKDNGIHSDDWIYHGEYIFMFFFNQAGDKIERILEFVDSAKVEQFRPLILRASKNLAARKGAST